MRRGESHAGVSCCPVHFILLCLAFLDLFKRCPTLIPYHQSMPLHRRLCCIHPHAPPALRITVSPLQFSLSAFSHSCPTPYPWSNARQILPVNLLLNHPKLKRTSILPPILEPPHMLKKHLANTILAKYKPPPPFPKVNHPAPHANETKDSHLLSLSTPNTTSSAQS